jgi:hypothetical protein
MASRILKGAGTLLLIFAAAYLGAHYFIRWRNTVNDDVTKISRLVGCHANELRELSIQQGGGGVTETLRFTRADKPDPALPPATALLRWEWSYQQPLTGEAEPVLLRRIAYTICELYDPIPLREGDMRPDTRTFLHAERLEAVLATDKGPEKISFEFGAVAADHTGVVRFHGPGGERVFRIPANLQVAASQPPAKYRNLRVMRLEADNVERAVLKIGGAERFTLERAGADWAVLLGGKKKGTGSEEAGKFVNRISTLQALAVEDPDFSPESCETMPAKAVLELSGVAGREERLRFYYGQGPDLVACSSVRRAKFRVHQDLLQFLDIPLKAVLAR